MLTLLKLAAGAVLALGILSPGFTPRADTCECKAKGSAALHQIGVGHAAGAVAEFRSRRTARSQFGEIDGVSGGHRNTQKNARSDQQLHSQSSLNLSVEVTFLPF